jgi:hypothetical protein
MAAEQHLLATGIILLPELSVGETSQSQSNTVQHLLEERASQLGWHPVTAQIVRYKEGAVAGWISIPAQVFKRGLGTDLVLICENKTDHYGNGKRTQFGKRDAKIGPTSARFAFGSEGQLVLDWVAAQDPRITKVLITKRGNR